MAYSLSFAQSFFWGEGNLSREEVPPSRRPTNVWQALKSIPEPQWTDLAREVFGVEPDVLDFDTVMAKVLETNTCTNLDSPVAVWIDPDGFHSILVY